MEVHDSLEEAAFRAEVKTWLERHARPRAKDSAVRMARSNDPDGLDERVRSSREWQRTLYDGGWAGITLPKQYGGRGSTGMQQIIFNEEQARFDVTVGPLSVAVAMVVPTLIEHGTEEQKKKHVDAILRGDELWCQLFSEPGAGSDLASLGTRAVLDGDEFVVSGHKVWNSFAQVADYGILLARTDPAAPKHHGITYLIVNMSSPGLDVRPLRQITGIAHFNEVLLREVRIPVSNVLGRVNEGWRVAQTTLANERVLIGGGPGAGNIGDIIALAKRCGVSSDPNIRQAVAHAFTRAGTLDYLSYRLRTAMSKGQMPGPEASVLKLAYSRHTARTGDLVMQIMGADAMLWGPDAPDDARWQDYFLNQYAVRLGGGTDEMQRTVIAERALGLPRDPVSDKGAPWRDLVKP
jgi:alkylation response protein AidB-like acyl-CoA dehydrogenase